MYLHASPYVSHCISPCISLHLQVIDAFYRFEYVVWPKHFADFVRFVNLPLDLELIPIDCLAGHLLSYYQRLLMTLLLPVGGSIAIVTLAIIARSLTAARRRIGRRCRHGASGQTARTLPSLTRLLASPMSWTLHVWMLLIVYPTLCSKTIAVFSCVELRDAAYLRADPALQCDTPEWWGWAIVCVASIAVYCLGIPGAFWLVTRRYAALRVGLLTTSRAYWWRARISLLLSSYRYDAWWFESFDLLRKLLLASVVLVAWPNTHFQLCFGTIVAAGSVLVTLQLQPYRHPSCQWLQVAAQLQVFFTYVTASVFYRDPRLPDDDRESAEETMSDVVLIAVNSTCFFALLVITCRGIRSSVASPERLVDSDGDDVPAPRLSEGSSFHLFLSHTWAYGQDQMRIVKTRTRQLLPGLVIFLECVTAMPTRAPCGHRRRGPVWVPGFSGLLRRTRSNLSSWQCRRPQEWAWRRVHRL